MGLKLLVVPLNRHCGWDCHKDEGSEVKDETIVFFSFKSKHSEDDILQSLRELWPDDETPRTTLVLRDRLGDHTLDYFAL